MAVKATELRKGQVIDKDGDLLLITDYHHSTPGNWRAIIQVKTRSLKTGQTGQLRPSSSESFEIAFLDRKKAEYLYKEATTSDYVFMDSETYEQFHLSEELVGQVMGYVKENETVEVTWHDSTPIGLELPAQVVLAVTESEAAVKGDTASNVKKEAVCETGLRVKVPLHVGVGDLIKVRTSDGEFQGRAKE